MSLFFFDTRSKMKDVLHIRNTSRQDVGARSMWLVKSTKWLLHTVNTGTESNSRVWPVDIFTLWYSLFLLSLIFFKKSTSGSSERCAGV